MTMMTLKLLTSLLKAPLLSTITRLNLSSSHKTSPISTLPTEILIHILKNLYHRDLGSCVLVSRCWCECAVELLWYNPYFPLRPLAGYVRVTTRAVVINKMASILGRQNQTFPYFRFIRQLKLLAYIDDDLFSNFSRCENLENLALFPCDDITGECLAKVLPHFANLVAIDLSYVVNTTSESIIGLAKVATRLHDVNLTCCTKVTDDAVLALAASCPLLHRVDLGGLRLLTDNAVSSLALSCPMLVELRLMYCELITDASIRLIWRHLIHIRELYLSYCSLLTDAAFPQAAPPKSPLVIGEHLLVLTVSSCSLITDDAIEGVVSHSPKIELVLLSRSATVERIASICRKLNRDKEAWPNFITWDH